MIKVDTQVIKPSAENVKRTEVVRVLAEMIRKYAFQKSK